MHTPRLLLVAALFGPSIHDAAVADAVRTVALSGTQAPGAAEGVTFDDFRRYNVRSQLILPVMNNRGEVAFTSLLTGDRGSARHDMGIFSEGDGRGLSQVLHVSDAAPGYEESAYFFDLSPLPRIDDQGEVYFTASVYGTNDSHRGTFRHGQGSTERIGTPVELFPLAQPEQYLIHHGYPRISDAGRAVIQVGLLGSVDDSDPQTSDEVLRDYAIFRERADGGFERVASIGQAAPALRPGFTFESAGPELGGGNRAFSMRGLLDSGQSGLAFAATLAGPGIDSSNDFAIYRSTPEDNQLILVARDGEVAPGSGPRATWQLDHGPRTSINGQTAFRVRLRGVGGVDLGSALYVDDGQGEVRRVAATGDMAPSVPGDFEIRTLHLHQINASGNAAVIASIRPSSMSGIEYGILTEQEGKLNLVAMTGRAAPEAGEGVFIDDLAPGTTGYVFNAAGQVAFNSRLAGNGVTTANDRAVYATDSLGNLRLVLREGAMLDVSDDPLIQDLRTVSRFSFNAERDGYTGTQVGFNDRGQIVFSAEFTDGTSGVFVSNLVAIVPEPGSLALVAFLALIAGVVVNARRHQLRQRRSAQRPRATDQLAGSAKWWEYPISRSLAIR